jgi:RimJ/RimL family protein N-acetyltransferase
MCSNRGVIEKYLTLRGHRVRLEPLSLENLAAVASAGNDPALWEFTFADNPFTNAADTQRWLHEATAPANVTFAVVDATTETVVGSTRYHGIDPVYRKLEIGWTFISRSHWRTFVNTDMKYLMLAYAFDEWNALRVQLKGDATNMRSRNAMERIGATFEGIHRAFRINPVTGKAHDVAFYSIIAPEWPAVRARLEARTVAG